MIKVSIIVPVYNVEKYIDRCMKSLMNQTLHEIEIILVDDGSPDSCPQMCDEYAKQDTRVKVIHKENAGLGYARNSGLEIATGEYVAFVDSDDYVDTQMFELLYNEASKNSLDIIYCGYNNILNGAIVGGKSEEVKYKEYKNEQCQEVLKGMLGNSKGNKNIVKYEMSVWHGIYKMDVIQSNHICFCSEREFCSEDIIFHIDIICHCKKIAFIPNRLYNYCLNPTSLTKSFRNDRIERHKILFDEIIRRIKENNYDFPDNVADNLFLLKIRYDLTIINQYNLSLASKYKYINEAVNKKIVIDLLRFIDLGSFPLRYRVFFMLVKYRCSSLLTLLILLK